MTVERAPAPARHDEPAMPRRAASSSGQAVADRAARRLMAQRRWRVWFNVVVFVVLTTIMVLVAMAERDAESVRACEERLSFTRDALEKHLATGDVAPPRLPMREPTLPPNAPQAEREKLEQQSLAIREHYFYNGQYGHGRSTGRLAGVCCCQLPHRLYLRADGRHVILFNGRHYELRWMTEREFRQQAASLGFTFLKNP